MTAADSPRNQPRRAADTEVQLLTFKLDEQEYALEIGSVVQVARMVAVTRAPRAPNFVEGMINLRGKIVPVINLRRRCGLLDKAYDLNTQLLIAQADSRPLALMVDVVSEVLTLPADALEPPEDIGAVMQHVRSVGKLGDRIILVLEPGSLLSDDDARLLN